jgi:hypothetical protein
MNRINLFGNESRSNRVTLDCITWSNFEKTGGTLVFAGILIACSMAVGCSSEKPKTASSNNNQTTVPQPTVAPVISSSASTSTPELLEAKPVHKKVVHRAPAMVAYEDKTSGVSFQYPRRYALKTGEAADKMVSMEPVPMDFVSAGGVTVAAVAVPQSAYPKSDLGAAFFDVSVHQKLTEEQCGQFSEAKLAPTSDAGSPVVTQPKKIMIGDMELMSSETVASQGTREEAAKYYHGFENGSCYEFALKVATDSDTAEGATHVDRERVFEKLEQILGTVKIAPKVADGATTTTSAVVSPAQ